MTQTAHPTLTPAVLATALDYLTYHAAVEQMVAEGRTSGPDQSQAMVDYTKLAWARMKRVYLTTEVLPEVAEAIRRLGRPQLWVAITEAWCGDAGQNLPVIARLAELTPQVTFRLIYRDEHPTVMDAYLTEGSRSIPKVIGIDPATGRELFVWGPRPAPAQGLLKAWKATPDVPKAKFYEQLQQWYNADKGHTLEREFVALAKPNA